jgi:hypothetical protein
MGQHGCQLGKNSDDSSRQTEYDRSTERSQEYHRRGVKDDQTGEHGQHAFVTRFEAHGSLARELTSDVPVTNCDGMLDNAGQSAANRGNSPHVRGRQHDFGRLRFDGLLVGSPVLKTVLLVLLVLLRDPRLARGRMVTLHFSDSARNLAKT